MVSLEDRGQNSETSCVNGVPNGLRMVLLCEMEENRSNGAYKWVETTLWGVIITIHCRVGEVGPKFLFLISLVSTSGFEIRDLQVRALAKSILFSGLHFEISHPGVLYEFVRVSMSQVEPFMGKRATRSHLWGCFEWTGRSFWLDRCDLVLGWTFFDESCG